MLRKHSNRWLLIVILALMLGACIPYSFSPPKEVHIDPGDHVALGKIAVDTKGRSHIVGNVFNHMVYYLTRFGEPIVTHNFTMGVPGTQYNQDIAVTDNGDVYIVWVESRSGLGKFACWQKLPFFMPPGEEWPNDCEPLDEVDIQTTGNVRVVARGNKAYAVYDRMYTGDSNGRIGELMYKELTNPSITGHVHWYTEYFETGFIYSLDLGIDSQSYLHVGFHDNYPYDGTLNERISLHSNASVESGHDMAQHWFIVTGTGLDEEVPVSLSFHLDSADVERVALASVSQNTPTRDLIFIDSCVANGCTGQNSHLVTLPSSWSTYSVIDEVEILGIEQTLYLSFTGFDSVIPQQVYFMEAYSSNTPTNLSQTDDTWKFTLEMTKVVGRDPSFPVSFTAIAWIESDLTSKTNYYVSDGFFNKTMVFSKYCDPVFSVGNISSNGIYLSGAWLDCGETWFSTQAWTNQLPLIMK